MCTSNIILNFLFIPRDGLLTTFGINGPTGAAVATLISGLIGFIGLSYYTKKLTKIKIYQKSFLCHIFAGVIIAIYLHLIKINFYYRLSGIPFYVLIVSFVVGIGMYVGILMFLKEFKIDDWNFFKDLISPKKMLKYLGGEFKK